MYGWNVRKIEVHNSPLNCRVMLENTKSLKISNVNQRPFIDERQTIQWQSEKRTKELHRKFTIKKYEPTENPRAAHWLWMICYAVLEIPNVESHNMKILAKKKADIKCMHTTCFGNNFHHIRLKPKYWKAI